MKIRTINATDAVELLRKQVEAEGEDYIYTAHYEDCVLAEDGAAACLVGRVYADLGVPVGDLENMAGSAGGEYYKLDVRSDRMQYVKWDQYGLHFTLGASRVLRQAQRRQDDGKAWGHALGAAQLEAEAVGGV